jgi:hypothetical protein
MDPGGEDGFVFLIARPRVLKGPNLRSGLGSVLLLEQHVVVLVALERRVQIDEANRLIPHIPPQNVQVIAVIKHVLHVNQPFSTADAA